ncbi:MAG: hypothetical protein LIP09_08005, partial [Bacteroidales bacterium]|nr:hypothetical protein [Bacteroidales bacterium]
PIGYTDLSGLKPSMEEAAAMADYVYGKKDVILIGKWIPSENTKYNLVSKTGLKTMLFQQDIGEGKVEYALAFAGTEWDTPVDAINDCLQLYGLSAQYQEGMTIGKEALNLEGELTFVGHSLGGGLSAACAFASGGQAMTFNPAGVSIWTKLPNLNAQIDAYVTITDPLTISQLTSCFLPIPDGNLHFVRPRNPIDWHGIDNFYGSSMGERVKSYGKNFLDWITNIFVFQ